MSHDIQSFPSHCASVIFHYFFNGSSSNYLKNFPKKYIKTAFAIFTNREDQKKAYDALGKKFKILYQSPIIKPAHKSQNPYFIVIYLNELPGE